jgi:tRNA (guanine9-N1)-methyltransferase
MQELSDSIFEEEEEEEEEEKIRKRPSKTIRKKLKYLKKLEFYRKKKEENKLEKKEKKEIKELDDEILDREVEEDQELKPRKKHKIKRLARAIINERLRKIHENEVCDEKTLRISIDCSFCYLMSIKEQSRLAQQIGRCYASNRATLKPAQITLTNINKNSFLYKEMCRVNDGFEKYVMIRTEKTIEEYYSNNLENLCYLSPDADEILENLDLNQIYIIGGLVDETVTKKVTLRKSSNLNLKCFRLPIEEHMNRRENKEEGDKKYNFSKILALNQVLDILLNYNLTKDWKSALAIGVPSRKGFCVDEQ